jgi:hypothetical protein
MGLSREKEKVIQKLQTSCEVVEREPIPASSARFNKQQGMAIQQDSGEAILVYATQQRVSTRLFILNSTSRAIKLEKSEHVARSAESR